MTTEHKPHIELHEIEPGRCRFCGWRTGGPSICGGCIRKGTDQRLAQAQTYERALRDIYEFENDGTHVSEIAREALHIRPPWAP